MDQLHRWWAELPQQHVVDPVSFPALWAKNYDCTKAPENWRTGGRDIQIASTVCPSGDVFVHAIERGQNFFSWLTLADIIQSNANGGGLASAARASGLEGIVVLAQAPGTPTPQPNIICHRFVDNRYLVRRVQTPQGCVDETIDMLNGTLISTKPAPCTQQC